MDMSSLGRQLYRSFQPGSLISVRLAYLFLVIWAALFFVFPAMGLRLSVIEGLPVIEIEVWAAGVGGTAGADALTAALNGAVCMGAIKANMVEPRHATHFQLANIEQA